MENLIINVDGKEYEVRVEETDDGRLLVHCGNDTYEVETATKAAIYETLKKGKAEAGSGTIKSPLPGIIYDVRVKKGQKVKEGQSLVTIIAMKMENNITAPKAGTIKEIKVKKNNSVKKGDVLVVID
ncbi:biotin/lipoyl-binding protein [archaeon AH-315-M20]|nr:biotin/lipoyl-binding protein [archaeon AH-315-M20]